MNTEEERTASEYLESLAGHTQTISEAIQQVSESFGGFTETLLDMPPDIPDEEICLPEELAQQEDIFSRLKDMNEKERFSKDVLSAVLQSAIDDYNVFSKMMKATQSAPSSAQTHQNVVLDSPF